MKTMKIEARGGPPLRIVLRELTERLVADDWIRHSTSDDDSFYYIIGRRAHQTDEAGDPDHLVLSVPLGGPVTAIGERQIHAQVASAKPGEYYLRRARRQLEQTGIPAEEVDRFLTLFEAGADFAPVAAQWQVNQRDRFEPFLNFLQALALRRGADIHELWSDAERRLAIDSDLEKIYLEELTRLFEGIVQRAGPLEELEFNDPQLHEASRCFLYGFFRGAVVLCASALETHLRRVVGTIGMERVDRPPAANSRHRGFFNRLVDEAETQGLLGSRRRPGEETPLVTYTRRVFGIRTEVVHKNLVPSRELAEELLTKAREVLEHLHDQPKNSGPGASER